jgi:hypothetical protein
MSKGLCRLTSDRMLSKEEKLKKTPSGARFTSFFPGNTRALFFRDRVYVFHVKVCNHTQEHFNPRACCFNSTRNVFQIQSTIIKLKVDQKHQILIFSLNYSILFVDIYLR